MTLERSQAKLSMDLKQHLLAPNFGVASEGGWQSFCKPNGQRCRPKSRCDMLLCDI